MRIQHIKILLLLACSLFLTGCANRGGLYQWGGYDGMLYQTYKNPEKAVEFRQGLELHIGKMEKNQQKTAPGLYAELGTLYLQEGDATKAVAMYTKERDAWPESKGLMDSLINNVGKRATGKKAEKS
jgi:hypothetical protein